MNVPSRYLHPEVLQRIASLELRARFVVEGFLAGLHRSPFRGASVEFAEHRQYSPGDDLRHLDWKVLAKTDRTYIKEYAEETNLRLYLLVDGSESMDYPRADEDGNRPARGTKYDRAALVAAAFATLAHRQRDASGLLLFDREVRAQVQAATSPLALHAIANALEEHRPARPTGLAAVLEDAARRIHHRSLVLLLSDLLDDPDAIVAGLKRLRRSGHDVVVFHVVDPDERDFPFQSLTRFEGLEGLPALLANPRTLRDSYLAAFGEFRRRLHRACREERIDIFAIETDRPPEHALLQYAGARARARERGR